MTPAHRPSRSPTIRRGNVQKSKARQVLKQARPKAIDFMSESEDVKPASNVVRFQEDDGQESDDQDASLDSGSGEEEDVDTPRVAQWMDDEQLELQASTSDDGSPSGSDSDLHERDDGEDSVDDDHTTGKAEHSRRLVGAFCLLAFPPLTLVLPSG
jgi:ribosomal RNA-processing protein 36